jgi:hypothetical protein
LTTIKKSRRVDNDIGIETFGTRGLLGVYILSIILYTSSLPVLAQENVRMILTALPEKCDLRLSAPPTEVSVFLVIGKISKLPKPSSSVGNADLWLAYLRQTPA